MDNLPDNPMVTCPSCRGTGTTKAEEFTLPGTNRVYAIGLTDTCPTCAGNKQITLEEYQRLQNLRQ